MLLKCDRDSDHGPHGMHVPTTKTFDGLLTIKTLPQTMRWHLERGSTFTTEALEAQVTKGHSRANISPVHLRLNCGLQLRQQQEEKACSPCKGW